MMTFGEYRLLREVLDVENTPVDDIKLQPASEGGYEYSQEKDGIVYDVKFVPTSIYLLGRRVQSYVIAFYADHSTSLTGKNQAPTVYNMLLLAVKKLLEQKQPDALSFSGSLPEQTAMYDIFIKRYLADVPGKSSHQVFYPIDSQSLVSKKFFLSLMPDEQMSLKQKIQSATKDRDKTFSLIKSRKKDQRIIRAELDRMLPAIVGKFVIVRDSSIIFILGKNREFPTDVEVVYFTLDGSSFLDTIPFELEWQEFDVKTALTSPKYGKIVRNFLMELFSQSDAPRRRRLHRTVLERLPPKVIQELKQGFLEYKSSQVAQPRNPITRDMAKGWEQLPINLRKSRYS